MPVNCCDRPEHKGLTVRCPDRLEVNYKDAVCLGCLIEYGPGVCGPNIWDAQGRQRDMTDEEWASLPESAQEIYDLLCATSTRVIAASELMRGFRALEKVS